jgi:uncharacterized protein (TIGR03083 family)
MASDMWQTIKAERLALADDLAGLTPEQWATKTLCEEWTVHDVVAHLVSASKMTPPKFLASFLAAGFNFDRFAAKQVAREGAGGPAATLAALRANAGRTSAPPGPKATWLGENLVHGEDIRRVLGMTRAYPLDAVAQVIGFYQGSEPIVHGKSRLAGLQLRATDTQFTVGSGELVEGPAVSLMMAAAGRKSALAELSGPGVETLRGR